MRRGGVGRGVVGRGKRCGGHGVVVSFEFRVVWGREWLWFASQGEWLEGSLEEWLGGRLGGRLGRFVLPAGGVCAIVCRSSGREARAAPACRRNRGVAQSG